MWEPGEAGATVQCPNFTPYHSDGYPADELKAALAAGSHPNLVSVMAKVVNGPLACVFPLIPREFRALGMPPSFETISRDVFPPSTSFSLSFAINVLKGIVSALCHLHSQGIMHGDLYAHNILVNDDGQALLVDFGAAAVIARENSFATHAGSLEARAFGCLIEDLTQRVADNEARRSIQLRRLQQLQSRCLDDFPPRRPLITEIRDEINDIIVKADGV